MNSDCKKLFHRFPDQYKSREVSVFKMVDSNYKANVKKAREVTAPIVDNVGDKIFVYLLRGHRDSGKNQPEPGEIDLTNKINFIELLNYRIRGGDKAVENHLRYVKQNARYTSP